jgi:hypothetical protein
MYRKEVSTMKTPLLFFALLAFCAATSLGQTPITIGSTQLANLYGPGKTQLIIKTVDTATATMNVGSASASQAQSWTFPSVQFVDTSSSVNVAPSSTPYLSSFPNATDASVASESDSSGTIVFSTFLRIVSDSLISLGGAEQIHEGTIDTTIFRHDGYSVPLPIALGTVTNSVDTIPTGLSSMEIQTTSTTFDAYGSITLPNGTFACLRSSAVTIIKFVQSEGSIPNDTSIYFSWYTGEGHQAAVGAVSSAQASGSIRVTNMSVTEVVTTTTSVAEKPMGVVSTFTLAQNYPNPFNPSTNISYTVGSHQFVSLQVYDVLGRKVATLVNEAKDAGTYSVRFDASSLPSGVYLYRLQAGNFSETKKLLLMK